jgi:hypothetical protein
MPLRKEIQKNNGTTDTKISHLNHRERDEGGAPTFRPPGRRAGGGYLRGCKKGVNQVGSIKVVAHQHAFVIDRG